MEDWDGKTIARVPADRLEFTFNLLAPFLPFLGGGKAIKNAPPIITESMIFPYFKGMVFCAKLTNTGGWSALDQVYKSPPLSTEQVLHPEKYQLHPDLPMSIDLGTLKAGDGWKEVGRNVLGEMQLGVMLRRHSGKTAAPGWDGDRYAVFEGPKGELALAWLSTWDSEQDAREFQQAYVTYQGSKVDGLGMPPRPIPDAVWRKLGDSLFVVERRGCDVAVVEGFAPQATTGLVDALFHAKKTEVKPVEQKKEVALPAQSLRPALVRLAVRYRMK
jgi:hypothetical protein